MTIDVTNKRFGKLIAIEPTDKRKRNAIVWKCICDCGEYTEVATVDLKKTKSCGCLLHEPKFYIHGHTSGGKSSPTFKSWESMKARCYNKNHHKYPIYGGRGIMVCERWMKFLNFLEDMGERPNNKTIDRIDPDGNYEPNNCKWSTSLEQRHNRRDCYGSN